jgi:hypothetical protein
VARRGIAWGTLVLVLVGVGACGGSPAPLPVAAPTSSLPPTTTTVAPTTLPPPSTTGVPVTTTPPGPPAFAATAILVAAADLPASWRSGCPVAPADLRKLQLSYWGFDDQAHTGLLVVHASEADKVTAVFRRLYERRFPIRRMEPIDVYGGSDDASIAADNTSGFNCRNAVASGPPQWSAHAYGRAIDVNPVENPYILDGAVLPPSGAAFLDRSNVRPGMAVRGGELVAAFASVGWSWGGAWANPDYQHFSASGN